MRPFLILFFLLSHQYHHSTKYDHAMHSNLFYKYGRCYHNIIVLVYVILLDSLSLHSFSFSSLFLLQLYITVLYSSVVFLILVVSYRIVFGMFNRKELYVVGISHILIDLVE